MSFSLRCLVFAAAVCLSSASIAAGTNEDPATPKSSFQTLLSVDHHGKTTVIAAYQGDISLIKLGPKRQTTLKDGTSTELANYAMFLCGAIGYGVQSGTGDSGGGFGLGLRHAFAKESISLVTGLYWDELNGGSLKSKFMLGIKFKFMD